MSPGEPELLRFSALAPFPHGFICRVPELSIALEKDAAIALLQPHHESGQTRLGLAARHRILGAQVHGATVACVDADSPTWLPGVDALITRDPRVCLGVYVADCCPVYLIDTRLGTAGLVHSGRKGTELGIVPATIAAMQTHFGTAPRDLTVQLGPCIRPPFYEEDFAARIILQCREAGVDAIHDCGENTGADLHRYYSYRMERGFTGRMLALLGVPA